MATGVLSRKHTTMHIPGYENRTAMTLLLLTNDEEAISSKLSPMELGKSDLNGEVTALQGATLNSGIQFGTEQG